MRVLVTGATGFIGRNVVNRLSVLPDVQIRAIHHRSSPWTQRKNIEWMQCDLRKWDDVTSALSECEIVIHCAATTSGSRDIVNSPALHVTDNAVMNSFIFRGAHEAHVRHVIFLSCSVMYPPSMKPQKESDFSESIDPIPSYFGVGWTKIYSEKMCQFYSQAGLSKFSVIRHSNVYGPHDKFDLQHGHVTASLILKALTATENLEIWGAGTEGRDLLFIDDLLDLIEVLLNDQQDQFELVNAGSGRAIRVKDLAQRIVDEVGRDLTLTFRASEATIDTTIALDCSRAFERYGWKPRTPLQEGLKSTVSWCRSHLELSESALHS